MGSTSGPSGWTVIVLWWLNASIGATRLLEDALSRNVMLDAAGVTTGLAGVKLRIDCSTLGPIFDSLVPHADCCVKLTARSCVPVVTPGVILTPYRLVDSGLR